MTKHVGKLREYFKAVARDYGVGNAFFEAIQSDLRVIGEELKINLVEKGVRLGLSSAHQAVDRAHQAVDHVAALGLRKLAELFAPTRKR